jgi:hypothetical protein
VALVVALTIKVVVVTVVHHHLVTIAHLVVDKVPTVVSSTKVLLVELPTKVQSESMVDPHRDTAILLV